MDTLDEQLREIDDAAAETLDVATREKAKRKAGSRREAYEKSLREARRVGDREAAGELAEWIAAQIRDGERFPTSRAVRKRGAEICRSMGYSVPSDSWLGA